jgi:hypothetical protein
MDDLTREPAIRFTRQARATLTSPLIAPAYMLSPVMMAAWGRRV